MRHIQKFLRDEQGLEAVEQGVVAGLIVVGALMAISLIGLWVHSTLGKFQDELHPAAVTR